jgi:hypothetical protein
VYVQSKVIVTGEVFDFGESKLTIYAHYEKGGETTGTKACFIPYKDVEQIVFKRQK